MSRSYLSQIDKIRGFAYEKHKGQVDKSGTMYYYHLLAVANSLPSSKVNDDSYYFSAILHDVLEDTDTTIDELKNMGLSDEVIDAIKALTHKKDEKYIDYIIRVKENEIARTIKIADLRHNTLIDRAAYTNKTREKDMARYEKYIRAYLFLTDKMIVEEYKEVPILGQNQVAVIYDDMPRSDKNEK